MEAATWSERRKGRVPPALAIAVAAALGLFTIVIIASPRLRFSFESSRASISVETAGAIVASLGCLLAFVRYRYSGRASALAMALAFLVLVGNQLVFAAGTATGTLDAHPHLSGYMWTIGRLYAGLLFLVMAVLQRREGRTRTTQRSTVVVTSITVLVLLTTQLGLWVFRDDLPRLSADPGSAGLSATGILPGLTALDLITGAVASALFLVAAWLLATDRERGVRETALVLALLFSAASQVHNLLAPSAFTNQVTTSNLLRAGFFGLLLVAVIQDVARRYAADQRRTARLEQLVKEREELSRLLTHDLRHAVGSMRAFAVGLIKGWDALPDAERLEVVGRLERETRRVRDLADETVLVMNEEQLFVPERRPEKVGDLVDEAIEAFDDASSSLEVELDPAAAAVTVDADRTQIYQVLRNLLRNAFQHGEGAPVRLRVTRDTDRVRFEVIDGGAGFPQGSDEPFRVRGRSEQGDGWGVGLYISREIVEAHGGSIQVAQAVPRGANVSFTLPRTVPE